MAGKVISIFAVGEYERHTAEASAVLRAGGVVILPTETVYGVAGLLSSETARGTLRGVRGEVGENQALTIHLARPEDAFAFLGEVSDLGRRLVRKLLPGPVGLVFEVDGARRAEVARKYGVEEGEIYSQGAITLRCPDHIIARDVIGGARGPVVLTMAPTVNREAAKRVEEISAEAVGVSDLVLDGGPARFSKPSTLLKVGAGGYEVVRVGVYDQRIIERMLKTTVLFVCSGNTCRSPMAWALARRQLAEKLGVTEDGLEGKDVNVISAGSFAMAGSRATPQALEAVRDFGADLSKHRSRGLTVELVQQADVIYTMGRSHRSAVIALVPSAAKKVVMLDPSGADVEDPIGSDVSVYRTLAGKMDEMIRRRLKDVVIG